MGGIEEKRMKQIWHVYMLSGSSLKPFSEQQNLKAVKLCYKDKNRRSNQKKREIRKILSFFPVLKVAVKGNFC